MDIGLIPTFMHQPQSSRAYTWLPDGLGFPLALLFFGLQ
jgi:hypothetical protein